MLTAPTESQLIGLATMHRHPRWRDVNEYIEAQKAALLERLLADGDNAKLHELRGWIKALNQFQSAAREASQSLEKQGRQTPL